LRIDIGEGMDVELITGDNVGIDGGVKVTPTTSLYNKPAIPVYTTLKAAQI